MAILLYILKSIALRELQCKILYYNSYINILMHLILILEFSYKILSFALSRSDNSPELSGCVELSEPSFSLSINFSDETRVIS